MNGYEPKTSPQVPRPSSAVVEIKVRGIRVATVACAADCGRAICFDAWAQVGKALGLPEGVRVDATFDLLTWPEGFTVAKEWQCASIPGLGTYCPECTVAFGSLVSERATSAKEPKP